MSAEIKVVGKSGQISLGKRYAGKMLRLERHPDGSIVLTAVAAVPESQLWIYQEPHSSRIQQGLAWAADHAPRDSDLDAMVRTARQRSPRKRP